MTNNQEEFISILIALHIVLLPIILIKCINYYSENGKLSGLLNIEDGVSIGSVSIIVLLAFDTMVLFGDFVYLIKHLIF